MGTVTAIQEEKFLYRQTGSGSLKVHYRHPHQPMTALCQSPSPSSKMTPSAVIPEGRQLCQSCEGLRFKGITRPLRKDRFGSKTPNQISAGKLKRALKRLGIGRGRNLVESAQLVADRLGEKVILRSKAEARAYISASLNEYRSIVAPKASPAQKEADAIFRSLSRPNYAAANSPDFLQSYDWRKLRMMALKEYGPRCQCCGATPKDGATMNVDHIKPRRKYPELALSLSNLQILCNECNHGKGNWDETDWR